MATLTDTAGKGVMGRIAPVTDEVSGEKEEKEKRKWINDAGGKKEKVIKEKNTQS